MTLPGSSPRLYSLPEGDLCAKMATSRRTSQQQQQQQQQNLSSPPRPDSSPLTPPESPTDTGGSAGGEGAESIGDPELSAEIPAPLLSTSSSSSSSSSTSSSTTGGGSSAGSTPDSGSASPGGSGCGTSGAFRELFEACRNGDVSRVKRLVDSVNVNAKDMAGRKSTPLHFAAGKHKYSTLHVCDQSRLGKQPCRRFRFRSLHKQLGVKGNEYRGSKVEFGQVIQQDNDLTSNVSRKLTTPRSIFVRSCLFSFVALPKVNKVQHIDLNEPQYTEK